ncbi:MAG: hypothetical protein ACI6PN_02355 [Polaribacter sp.]|uniref:hypothetical protein n=1 Tax=Polaribacter sp. TaxID=1920175 RepID=UPI00384BF6C9
MKYVYFYYLGLTLLLFSCTSKETDVAVFKYSLEGVAVESYLLNTAGNDSLMLFSYQNLKDSIPFSDVSYAYHTQELRFRGSTFSSTGTEYEFENLVFTMYQEKTSNANLVTLVFNENYGLLASLGFGENFIFSKELMIPKIKEYNFKRLFRSLNNIIIE